MKKTILLTAIFFSFFSIFSQKTKFKEKYTSYFEQSREIPFLHLNKTSFFRKEELWFKAYILEQGEKKLHEETSNLYLTIFDHEGKWKDQKLVKVNQGMAIGNILIDSTFTQGEYYLKASTNWMKNFDENNAYVQKFTVLNKSSNKQYIDEKLFYEFKILPEGGHLLSGTRNNLGILIKDKNNKGVKIEKGVIKDRTGEIVKVFETNDFGFGNVNLFFEENQQYKLEATLKNGTILTEISQKPELKGISMRVINSNEKRLFIHVNTNMNTLPDLASKNYYVAVHNTRNYAVYDLPFNGVELKYILSLKKEKLSKGINIITVFNEKFVPLLERLVYNHGKDSILGLEVNVFNQERDSLTIQFDNKNKEKIFLSASFLPRETKGYNPQNNIYSSFVFQPYVKGHIQDCNYYLKDVNHKKMRDLDLLLLTQGWSKYSWNNIFNHAPTVFYPFEKGISIFGKLNDSLKKNESLFIGSKEQGIRMLNFNIDGAFQFLNMDLKEKTTFNFAIFKKGKRYKRVTPPLQFSNRFLDEKLSHTTTSYTNLPYKKSIADAYLENPFVSDELLDTVEVRGQRKDKKKIKFPLISIPFDVGIIREEPIYDRDISVMNFLERRFYRVLVPNYWGEAVLYGSCVRVGLAQCNPRTRVILDGIELFDPVRQIQNLMLRDVESIGFAANTVVIERKPWEQRSDYKYTSGNYLIEKGFLRPKEYYSPEFNSYQSDSFKKYGAIFWEPEIVVESSSIFTLKIPTKSQKKINVYVEGISENGGLISKKIIL